MDARYVFTYTLPAAYAVLPAGMSTPEASRMLLAIGAQESEFHYREQIHGPARGYWQFEMAGVLAVMDHKRSAEPIHEAIATFGMDDYTITDIHQALRFHDPLAACFARCLLWANLLPLPVATDDSDHDADAGWQLYLSAWRPGKPRPSDWSKHYQQACDLVGG